MKVYIDKVSTLARSQTAKDTYILFVGNLASAFFGFLFVLFVARGLSVEEFGVFSAATNLIIIIASFTDLGISSGVVNFIAMHLAKGEKLTADKYLKASFVVRLLTTLLLVISVGLLAPFVSRNFLATSDPWVSYWVGIISLGTFFWSFFPNVLQAQKRFLASVVVDLSLMAPRALFAFLLLTFGFMSLTNSFAAHVAASIFVLIFGFIFSGISFLSLKPGKAIYAKLFKYSGWIGVNRLISSVSGRLDITMLAAMIGASGAGVYGIASRLASFIIVLSGSFGAVLAPRLAAFGDKEREKAYILKATLALIPIIAGIVFWIMIAEPFVTILFGVKYAESVPVFQALAAAMIPFLLTVPSVTAIIYAMKKTVYIGTFSFFQLAAIFLLNWIFIPKYGPLGPTIAFGITNTILAVYTWLVVIRHYWERKHD